jgi:uncharacterized cupredoxin-like copper-binding protein
MKQVSAILFALSVFAPMSWADEAKVIDVVLDSYTIKPERIVVKANEPVTLKLRNDATFIPHNLVVKAPDAGIDFRVDVRAGKTGEVTFTPTKAGTYEMYCDKEPPIGKSHREKGMHGTLVVE